MTIRDTGGPAFPTPCIEEGEAGYQTVCTLHGMNLRDYFAAAALKGLLATDETPARNISANCGVAYQYADEMLKRREQP